MRRKTGLSSPLEKFYRLFQGGASFVDHCFSVLLYPLFSLEKKGIQISCQSRSVVRPFDCPSVCLSVCPSVPTSVTFLVNVSPTKPLEVVN